MPNIENLKPNMSPEPTPEQFKKILDERTRLRKKLDEIDSEIEKRKKNPTIVDRYETSPNPDVQLFDQYGQLIKKTEQVPTIEPVVEPAPKPIVDTIIKPTIESIISKPVIKIETKQTQAELLAQKIRRQNETGETLSPEDLKYRSEHWPEVEAALIKLAQPPKSFEEKDVIENTKPTLANVRERIEVLKKEREVVNKESIKNEDEETKKRIEKVLSKEPESGTGMMWLAYLPASPTIAGVWAGNQVADQITNGIDILKKKFQETMNASGKKPTLKEKYGNKKPEEKKNSEPGTSKEKSEEAIKLEKEKALIETRKKEFLEKAFKEKLEGKNLDAWNKFQKVKIGSFFNPAKVGWDLERYHPWERTIYDKLLPIYQKEPTTLKDEATFGDYLTSLAKQDKLKDLWTQTSNNNS